MALTLVRHAALAKEHQGRYNGWTDLDIDPELFDEGKVELLRRQKFDIVYSSDLVRCQQTLEILGIEEYITDERLREVRFKDEVEGLNFQEVEKLSSFKVKYTDKKKDWHNYICDESNKVFKTRVKSFLDALDPSKEILICSHAGTIQRMMKTLGYSKGKVEYLESIRIDNAPYYNKTMDDNTMP
jgi:broad specificity phosphatase PhoE